MCARVGSRRSGSSLLLLSIQKEAGGCWEETVAKSPCNMLSRKMERGKRRRLDVLCVSSRGEEKEGGRDGDDCVGLFATAVWP